MAMKKLKSTRCNNYSYPGIFVPSPLQMDDIFNELKQVGSGMVSVPLMNVVETPDSYNIEVAAPGIEKNNFLVSIHDNVLSVSVLNKDPGKNNKIYHQQEFNYNCFKRELPLPEDIDLDFLSASYHRGILNLNFPKGKGKFPGEVERVIIY